MTNPTSPTGQSAGVFQPGAESRSEGNHNKEQAVAQVAAQAIDQSRGSLERNPYGRTGATDEPRSPKRHNPGQAAREGDVLDPLSDLSEPEDDMDDETQPRNQTREPASYEETYENFHSIFKKTMKETPQELLYSEEEFEKELQEELETDCEMTNNLIRCIFAKTKYMENINPKALHSKLRLEAMEGLDVFVQDLAVQINHNKESKLTTLIDKYKQLRVPELGWQVFEDKLRATIGQDSRNQLIKQGLPACDSAQSKQKEWIETHHEIIKKIKDFELCENWFIKKIPPIVRELQGLESVQISHTSLEEIQKDDFPENSKITSLDLDESSIQHIAKDTFENLRNLKTLILSCYACKTPLVIEDGAFSPLVHLEELDLSGREIDQMPSSLFTLKNLKELKIPRSVSIESIQSQFREHGNNDIRIDHPR